MRCHLHIESGSGSSYVLLPWINLLNLNLNLNLSELRQAVRRGREAGWGHRRQNASSCAGCLWWCHQMKTFLALLARCEGNPPATGAFPSQGPLTRSFDVFFDLRLNQRLMKQSRHWWFETPSRSLWRHCNAKCNYVNRGIIVVKSWFSRALHEPYIIRTGRERNLKVLNTGVSKRFFVIIWYTNPTWVGGRFRKSSTSVTRTCEQPLCRLFHDVFRECTR